jgi:hypothetical protein
MTDAVITADTAARAAALWWAQAVGAPVFDGLGSTRDAERAADPRHTGAYEMAELLAGLNAAQTPMTDDMGQRFADLLTEVIARQLDGRSYGVSLGVDYGPDLELGDAARAAGISLSRFPWKTNMWVKADHVTVSAGYGAPTRIVWSAPDWERPLCGQRPYDVETHKSRDELCGLPLYHEGDHGEFTPDPARCTECGGGYSQHYTDEAHADPNRHPFRREGSEW